MDYGKRRKHVVRRDGDLPLNSSIDPVRRPSYWWRRLARHAKLAAFSLLVGTAVWTLATHRSTAQGLSLASAYAGLVLLAVALALGPINVLRRRPQPVSTDLRRDVGIWAALFGIGHTIVGLQVHANGEFTRYFLPTSGTHFGLRTAVFLTANYLGMSAAVLLLVLMLVSNDLALRKLGVSKWKLIQRSAYVVVATVVFHGALYQISEKRTAWLVIVFATITLIVVVLQVRGFRAKTDERSVRKRAPKPEEGAAPR